jgi:hypothetical protein
MLRAAILISLLAITLPASAKLYKCQDAQGNIVYTDTPCEDGEELKLPPIPTYTPRRVPTSGKVSTPKREKFAYTLLEISKPAQEELIIENTGKLEIAINLEPSLRHLDGHRIVIALDGKQLKTKGTTTRVRLDNVNPGSHTVQAIIVDRGGAEVKKSGVVSFYMKRQSALRPQLTPGPQRVPTPGGAQRALPLPPSAATPTP